MPRAQHLVTRLQNVGPAIEVHRILKAINVPTLVMQGDDNQVVPYKDAALLQAKLLKNSALKIYPGYPHGMCTTNADLINSDLFALIHS